MMSADSLATGKMIRLHQNRLSVQSAMGGPFNTFKTNRHAPTKATSAKKQMLLAATMYQKNQDTFSFPLPRLTRKVFSVRL